MDIKNELVVILNHLEDRLESVDYEVIDYRDYSNCYEFDIKSISGQTITISVSIEA